MRPAALALLALCLAGAAPGAIPAPAATLAFARSEVAGGGVFVATGGRARLVARGGIQPSWSPDARRLAYVAPGADGAGDVYATDADGRRRGRITHTAADERHPDWSRDGRHLVVERDGQLLVVRADGGRERRLARGRDPDWSPDGRLIAFASDGELFVARPWTGRITRVTQTAAEESEPAWSRDGRRIAYASDDGAQTDVFSLDVRTGVSTRLTADAIAERSPAWSADGGQLLYVAEVEAVETVWSVPAAGGAATPLGLPGFSADPAARPPVPRPVELLPDFEQRPPTDLSLRVERRGGRPHFLLGFDSATDNLGDGPITLLARRPNANASTMSVSQIVRLGSGATRSYPSVGVLRYVYASSHSHWHVLDFQRYELRRLSDHRLVVRDRKSGFCLADHWAHAPGHQPNEPRRPVYNGYCERGDPDATAVLQGTSVGYTDKYPSHFHGQNLDLTGVPAGNYVLVNRANPDVLMRELRYENNAASLRIRLTWSRGVPTVDVLDVCPASDRC